MIRPLLFFVLMSPFSLMADTIHMESGELRNTLVELYTSEGCSSCPPAEKYLNNLKKNKGLWQHIIPIAFHVNYWDYLGWRDPFAHPLFGQRQSQYAKLKRVTTVYTPAFIVNGNAWRPGIFSSEIKNENQKSGILIVDLENNMLHATYKSLNATQVPLNLNVAVLGMGLLSNIERGENAGRKAEHEFVVVGYEASVSKTADWKIKLPVLHYQDSLKHALAVWVSTVDNPAPLQAVGSYIQINK